MTGQERTGVFFCPSRPRCRGLASLHSSDYSWPSLSERESGHLTQAYGYSTAIIAGCVLWLLAMALGDRTEAWDSPVYWTVSYPLAIVITGYIAWRIPEQPWRWGLAIMFSQAVVLAFTAADFSLLPLGLVLFGVLAIPPIALGYVTSGIRLRSRPG